jgi:hypothetical protein
MAEDTVKERKGGTKEKQEKNLWWPFAACLLIFGMLAGLGIFEYQKSRTERDRLEQELSKAKIDLAVCKKTQSPKCDNEPKKVLKKARKVHRYTAPKSPVVKPKVEEKKFNPKVCGEGTEMVVSRATGEPECRATHALVPAPLVTKAEAPKPEMKCEKPLIRELREDGSIACIVLPAPVPVTQPVPQVAPDCFPPDAQGRIFCRRTEAKSGSSWIPWVLGGAAVLAVIANNRRGNHGSSPPPVVTMQGPSVTTLPPGPGVTTLPPGPGVVTH